MKTIHQQIENEHAQCKVIVLCRTIDTFEIYALQFWRGKFGLTDSAAIEQCGGLHWLTLPHRQLGQCHLIGCPHLKRIGINQRDQRFRVNQHIALVEITDDVVMGMH